MNTDSIDHSESRDTRLSMLVGLKNSQERNLFEDSWLRFNKKYTPLMYSWIRSKGLSQADSEEICQALMVKLLSSLKTFPYDPAKSFRAWLATVTRNAVNDFLKSRAKQLPTDSATLMAAIEEQELQKICDNWFDREIYEEAKLKVADECASNEASHRDWQIFEDLETGLDIDVIAEKHQVQKHVIYVAKNRVKNRLREKIKVLETKGFE